MNIESAMKAIGPETQDEMDAMGEAQLHSVVVNAERAMRDVKEELSANREYIAAKGTVDVLTQPLRELNKRQKGKIAYALFRLVELGKG